MPRRSVRLLAFLLPAVLAACGGPSVLVVRRREDARLLGTDRRFALLAQREGARRAFARYLEPNAVFFPEGAAPLVGRRAILEALPGRRGPRLEWTPEEAWVSRHDTSGSTNGVFEVALHGRGGSAVRYGDYLALWVRRDGLWRIREIMQNLRPGL
jgi:hypothetical protein